MANSTGERALTLGPQSYVSGDLIAGGQITLANSEVEIGGEVRPYSSPSQIPRIDLAFYDPRSSGNSSTRTELSLSYYRNASLQGKVLRDGNLQLGGVTTLDGALLFVDGNLDIVGTITGRGALICTGHLSIGGTQSFLTDNELALLAGADLSILGNGVDKSKIEGLIYAEGDVEVRNSTVQGTLISQANGGTIPRVVLERSAVVYSPEAMRFRVNLNSSPTQSPTNYLVFSNAGHFNQGQTKKDAGSTNKVAVGISAGESGSGFYVFSSDETSAEFAGSITDAERLLGLRVASELGMDLPPGESPWSGSKGNRTNLLDALQAVLADSQVKITTSQEKTATSGAEAIVEIDPMRFLKYGDAVRVRSVRMLEREQNL